VTVQVVALLIERKKFQPGKFTVGLIRKLFIATRYNDNSKPIVLFVVVCLSAFNISRLVNIPRKQKQIKDKGKTDVGEKAWVWVFF